MARSVKVCARRSTLAGASRLSPTSLRRRRVTYRVIIRRISPVTPHFPRPASRPSRAMGFPLADVLTSDDLIEEFACKICTELVEYTKCSYTKCGHVFCSSCLGKWMARAGTSWDEAREDAAMNGTNPVVGTRCPTCNTGIERNTVSDLKLASPLAWRLLGRVKVRCPTHTRTHCGWQGDFSEVDAHLTDSKSHTGNGSREKAPRTEGTDACADDQNETDATTNAEALKEQGNAKFSAKAFKEAIQLYSKAISVAEQSVANAGADRTHIASYYSNRAAAWLHVGAHKECVEDCRKALVMDELHVKAHLRLVKALCESSDVSGASYAAAVALKKVPLNREIAQVATTVEMLAAYLAEGEKQLDENDPVGALETFTHANDAVPCAVATLGIAKSEILLGQCDRASRTTLQVIKRDSGNSSAYTTRGHALCLADDFDQGLKHLKEALRLDPDHRDAQRIFRKMKKTFASLGKAREAVKVRDFEQAETAYTDAISISEAPEKSPLFAVTLGERGNVFLRVKKFDDAISDCTCCVSQIRRHRPFDATYGVQLASATTTISAPENKTACSPCVSPNTGRTRLTLFVDNHR